MKTTGPRHVSSGAWSNQLQPFEARVPRLAHDDVIVHGDAERTRDVDDRSRHLDVGLRGRGIARRVVVQHAKSAIKLLAQRENWHWADKLVSAIGIGIG